MAKKNFSGGLDSLLGGSPLSNNTSAEKKVQVEQDSTPVSSKVIPTTASQLNALTDQQKSKIKALANKEGRSENEIIREAISFYLDFQVDL